MATPSNPRFFGIHLQNQQQRARWNDLVKLPVQPSRYPDDSTLHTLGIRECFWELCAVGGLTTLFRWQQDSFRCLTLEFLSTLHVRMAGWRVESITFRLRNRDFDMSITEFNAVFNFHGEDMGVVDEPEDYDRNAFWAAITLPERDNERFNAARAKASQIRNPVLRFLQKACAYLPFARFEAGSIQSDDVFLLWNILNGRSLDMGHFIIKHLERQARKTSGILCCGGVITSLAIDCDIDVDDFVPDMGEKNLTLEVLKQVKFLNVDQRLRGYFLQKAGDHFPFPDPINTYVNGWQYQINWRMNEDVHRQIVAMNPPQLPWAQPRFRPHVPFPMPDPNRPNPPPLQLQAPNANPDEAGPANRRRRRRRQPERGEEDVSIHQRLDQFQSTLTQINHRLDAYEDHQRRETETMERLNNRLDAYEDHQRRQTETMDRLNNRLDVYDDQQRIQTETMDRFNTMMTSMYDRFNTWSPYPPPPPQE